MLVDSFVDQVVLNRVICATRMDTQRFVSSRMQIRELVAGNILYDRGDTLTHAIFPHVGILSVVADMPDGGEVEMSSIGNEGFVGLGHLTGAQIEGRIVVQIGGYGSFLSIADLEEAMSRFTDLREAMMRYAGALIVQLMATASCNAAHTAEQRVTRWLLQADERMMGRKFEITQASLASAMSLRRPTVSNVCSDLLADGIIGYSRGVVAVTNRAALRARSCGCYERIAAAAVPPPAE